MPPRASARTPDAPPHPVDEILPARRLVPAALQHVASMYAGLTAPPLIIGSALGLTAAQLSALLAAALLVAGLGTIAQTLGLFGIGARLPLTNGVSFAVVSPALATAATEGRADALPAIFGATLVAGITCLVLAPAFCRLVRFFPPVVSGCVITLVGISLLPVASVWARGGEPDAPDFGSPSNLALAAATLAITLLIHRVLSGRFLGRIAILLGMLAGTLIAVPLGKVNLDPLGEAPLFALPEPFAFGTPRFVPTVIATAIVVMLVSMMESTASLLALGAVTGRPTKDRTITGSLRAQGLATVLGGVLGSFTSTSYAQNVGLVALSRIRSRYVVTLCGAILALMGLVPVLGSLVALVPLPVLGGAGVVFFGSVAVAGIRTLAKASLSTGHNSLIVSVTLAFGLFPIANSDFYARLPSPLATVLGSGITAGCLVAVLLNYLLNHLGRGTQADLDRIPTEHITALDRGRVPDGPPAHAAPPGSSWSAFRTATEPLPDEGRPRPPARPTPAAGDWPAYDPNLTGFPDAADTLPPASHPFAPASDPFPPASDPFAPAGGDPAGHEPAPPTPTYEAAAHAPAPRPHTDPADYQSISFPGPLHPLRARAGHSDDRPADHRDNLPPGPAQGSSTR
ncbi:nucleobase:cation symporter-2 family protein [Streptomyces sp. NPDC057939]|uniref:nucleobase:cation symporter-2 family protein n=1 Tax=Streptomyces sp. NPDC057939 TaxID=3346284 RepID=UPI0036E30C08